ncbi:MAG: hypothetical protein AAF682_26555 [Planctomycetota bacterium]
MFLDPRLDQQLRRAREATRLRVVLVAHPAPRTGDAARGAAGPVVDAVARELGRAPHAVRYLPRGHIAVVEAERLFLDALARHPGVAVLSAVDADRS